MTRVLPHFGDILGIYWRNTTTNNGINGVSWDLMGFNGIIIHVMEYTMVIYTLWLFNIAMENPNHKWRFIAGKIIYKRAIFHGYVK